MSSKSWNKLITKKETLVIDARKPFEYSVGTFKKAINPNRATICINIFCVFGKILDNKESINIGIPKNVGINEVIELLPLATETIIPHVIKKTLKTIEKLIAFKPKNLNCWEMFSFIKNSDQ